MPGFKDFQRVFLSDLLLRKNIIDSMSMTLYISEIDEYI